jgi:hypothetical protein
MLSKLAGITAVLTLWAGLLLATPAAQAAPQTKTVKGTFKLSGQGVSIGSSFSFDGVTANNASLNTFSGNNNFPTEPSLNGPFTGQNVAEYSTDITKPCTFTGVFGEPEPSSNTDVTGTLTLVGFAGASNGALGSSFAFGQTALGCIDDTDGAFAITQTDSLIGGPTGALKNATGTESYTGVGFTLAPSGAAGSFGFFDWFTIKKGKVTWQIPVH